MAQNEEPHSLAENYVPAPRVGFPAIDDSFIEAPVPPARMDELWRLAWRHFGPIFVRYSISPETGRPRLVQPLRVALERFAPSKSQRRILRRNADLEVKIQPTALDDERRRLFERHKRRFQTNVPEALENFLGDDPAEYPCENVEVAAFKDGQLIAASYLDLGLEGASSLYGMFCPEEARRSLGIATMLWELAYASARGCRYYYPGYAFHEPSALDYKKQFAGAEWYDWRGRWRPLAS